MFADEITIVVGKGDIIDNGNENEDRKIQKYDSLNKSDTADSMAQLYEQMQSQNTRHFGLSLNIDSPKGK